MLVKESSFFHLLVATDLLFIIIIIITVIRNCSNFLFVCFGMNRYPW